MSKEYGTHFENWDEDESNAGDNEEIDRSIIPYDLQEPMVYDGELNRVCSQFKRSYQAYLITEMFIREWGEKTPLEKSYKDEDVDENQQFNLADLKEGISKCMLTRMDDLHKKDKSEMIDDIMENVEEEFFGKE